MRVWGRRLAWLVGLSVGLVAPARAAEVPTPEMFRVLEPQGEGPRITPYLA